MITEGSDQHHAIQSIDELDFEGIERELEEISACDTVDPSYVEPIIDRFRVGLLYECFVDGIRNGATSTAAREYFHVDKPCTLVVRCQNDEEKTLFMVGLENILDCNYRQKFAGERPEKSTAIDFDIYEDTNKRKGKDGILNVLFEHNRVFLFMSPDQQVPAEVAGFIDAEIALRCTPEALEAAVKKYIEPTFCLDVQIGEELMAVPVSQLLTIFCEGRHPFKSCELAYAYLEARKRGEKPDNIVPAIDASAPTLDDLHGLGAAGDWGRDLATDLADWQAGRISWSEIDRGVLISGPPGTGKTTFAAALARTCDVQLIATSMAQWQAKGHLGDYLKAMRASFAEAQKKAPCILFIDEFDSAGDRNRSDSDNASYDVKAINGLLECLDGIAGREGVIVVGATNDPGRIDHALRRPGRLERVIEIPLPDAHAREGILRFHLRDDLDGVDLRPVIERTEGMAGAWLEALVRQGRRAARRQRREMQLADLLAALPARVPMPAKTLEMSAIHEAGHAIVAIEIGKKVLEAKVTREVLADANAFDGGYVRIERGEGEIYLRSKSQTRRMILQLLGGLAAEDIVFGERNDGGSSDLREATWWAARMEMSTGQSDRLIYLAAADMEPVLAILKGRLDIQQKVEETLQQCMSEARAIVARRRDDVRKIADALVEHGHLTRNEINELLPPNPKPIRLLCSDFL
ncbi:AAA family ATPase [Brucella intermedia]|uniref:AAA family ATPase n=1 Tax=Brucella intermedia TaxID=94625 RepID=UPI00124F4C3B|nr:AAA family ATPase [Brucella intermedia]KAB2715341.1 AAA family ATPase [Brucella intermedia]